MSTTRGATAWALISLVLAGACSAGRPYVWADDLPVQRDPASGYRISVGDVISVKVWNQDAMSVSKARVRTDGRIGFPFLRDVSVAGLAPSDLAAKLEVELEKYVLKPLVIVSLDEVAPENVSVLGEVSRPGAYDLHPGAGVLHALAAASGLTEFARRDSIYVLRREPGRDPTRIRFRYGDLTGGGRSAAFALQSGDVVVVE